MFDKDMEIRKLKSEINDFKSKFEIATEEVKIFEVFFQIKFKKRMLKEIVSLVDN